MGLRQLAAIFLGATTLLACAGSGRADAGDGESPPASPAEVAAVVPVSFDPAALADREWRLVALPGADAVVVPDGTQAMLHFEAQPDGSWQASGHGPCNQLSTPVAFSGDAIEFVRIASSKRACAELALETAWVERMRAGKGVAKLDGERLEISRDGAAVMVFEAGPVD